MRTKLVLAGLFILSFAAVNIGSAVAVASEASVVNLVFQVTVRSMDNAALKNSTVKILETGDVFTTNENGATPLISLKLPPDCLGKDDWAAVTLVVKHAGYITTVLYNCIVYPKRTRYGPTVHMLIKDDGSPPFIALVELPPDSWTSEAIK